MKYQFFKSFLCYKYKDFTHTIILYIDVYNIFTDKEIETLYNENLLYKIYYIGDDDIKYYFLKSNLYDYVFLNNYHNGDEYKICKDLNIKLIDIIDYNKYENIIELLIKYNVSPFNNYKYIKELLK